MPRYERIVNHNATTLNGAINDTVTSVTVTDAGSYPLLGDFRILVGSEVMHVISRASHTLTVVRGVDGTSAASHSDLDTVDVILTKAGLDSYFDHVLSGPSARYPARLLDASGNRVTASDFTFDNQGTAFAEDNPDGSITLVSDENETANTQLHVLYKTAPTAPWTVTAGFQVAVGWDWASTQTTGGLLCRENSTGEFINLSCSTSAPGGALFDCFHWNSPISFNVRIPGLLQPDFNANWVWMQIEDDNVDLFFRVSYDGINFYEIGSDTRTDFMAGGPDEIGFSISERGQGSAGILTARHEITLKSWTEE